jgi:hypothetical protein
VPAVNLQRLGGTLQHECEVLPEPDTSPNKGAGTVESPLPWPVDTPDAVRLPFGDGALLQSLAHVGVTLHLNSTDEWAVCNSAVTIAEQAYADHARLRDQWVALHSALCDVGLSAQQLPDGSWHVQTMAIPAACTEPESGNAARAVPQKDASIGAASQAGPSKIPAALTSQQVSSRAASITANCHAALDVLRTLAPSQGPATVCHLARCTFAVWRAVWRSLTASGMTAELAYGAFEDATANAVLLGALRSSPASGSPILWSGSAHRCLSA